jgi:hypothetical protein
MPRETKPTRRFGVFATIGGWLLTDDVNGETFTTRNAAVATARRLAHVARWRGARAEVLAQDRPGGVLRVIDPPREDRAKPEALEPD